MAEIKECRICGSEELEEVFRIGYIYPSGFHEFRADWPQKQPLILVECGSCFLTQLKHTINLDSMYREYWYRSGLNTSMVSDLQNVVTSIEERIELNDGDTVVDIGCNDGTLFDFYTADVLKVGFDPALNLQGPADKHCDIFINDYFKAIPGINNAKVITAIAMFYDLPDPVTFLEDVKATLADDGIIVLQFTDLYSMFKINAFDNICHEHLEYYKLSNIVDLCSRVGLKIFDVEYNGVNGGSLRAYITRQENGTYDVKHDVTQALTNEFYYFESLHGQWYEFNERVIDTKEQIDDFLWTVSSRGKGVIMLGASTKGNTLLQYFGLTGDDILLAAEINSDKYGLHTVGSDIVIVSEDEVLNEYPPDYLFVPTWHFIDHFIKMPHLLQYMDNGGKLVVPMPQPKVYYKEEGEVKWMLLRNHLECLWTNSSLPV